MKQLHKYGIAGLLVFFAYLFIFPLYAQDSSAPNLNLGLTYFLSEVNTPFLGVSTRIKEGKKFLPVKDISVSIFMGQEVNNRILGKVVTNEKGEAYLNIPPGFQQEWDSLSAFSFSAVSDSTGKYASTSAEASITKAKMTIDTAVDGETRNIKVTVLEQSGKEWKPVKDVELKIFVKRLLGDLPISEEESYTTDSLGQVTAEFKRDGINGNSNGEIFIAAKVEDNDQYGNLAIAKKINWGRPYVAENTFNKRTLWATRDKAPLWLLFLASFIIIMVWGVIIYLARQIIRMRKIGKMVNA
jgi:hypothetical protein